jgi:hypothetical protein
MSRLTDDTAPTKVPPVARPNKQDCYKLLIFWLLLSVCHSPVAAQQTTYLQYKAKIVLTDGSRLYGTIGLVTDEKLTVDDTNWFRHNNDGGTVALSDIRKIIIKVESHRNARITGAILGGLLTGFAAVNSLEKNPTRSPVLGGATITLSVAAGAGMGMLTGHLIGNTKRIVVRPVGTDPETIARSLKLQIEPFSYASQQRFLNKAVN